MEYNRLFPDNENLNPFVFFDETPIPETANYKIYNDGGHYVATLCVPSNKKIFAYGHKKQDIDYMFDSLYFNAIKSGLKPCEIVAYIKSEILLLFPDKPDIDEFIADKIKVKQHNFYVRKKRFRRKAHLNKWNYFVTFTYDDKYHTAESFRKKLRKCLSNLHTRRGWRYMGVFELAPETGRLHFHGMFYVPDGEMVGKIVEKADYSTAQGKMQVRHENEFFQESFGRNDFAELNSMELKKGQTLNYILKYIEKQGERIVYSRGIATEICKEINIKDIATTMQDFVLKFLLYDDTIDWERDVMNYEYRQTTITDLLCNPSTYCLS